MAQIDNTCLNGVIGLANCDCPCRTDIAPEGFNESESGLFVADLVPLHMVGDGADCSEANNPWNVLDRARTRAATQVMSDFRAGIMKRNKFKRDRFKGVIGEKSARDVASITDNYAGVRFFSHNRKGAYLKVTKIGGVFNGAGTVDVRAYDHQNATASPLLTLTIGANGAGETSCNILLPLWSDGFKDTQYFFAYEVAAIQPKKTSVVCTTGCSRDQQPVFSTNSPYFSTRWSAVNKWANWVMVSGWKGEDLTSFDVAAENVTGDNYTNGLWFEAELWCDPASSLCLGGLDYQNAAAMSLAHAFRYMAAIEAARILGQSPDVLRAANLAKDYLTASVQEWWKDYEKNIEFAAYHANPMDTDCITCNPAISLKVSPKLP